MISVGDQNNEFVNSTIASMKKHNMPMEILNSEQAKVKYPMISYPDEYSFVLDHSGGILRADKCLKAFQVKRGKHVVVVVIIGITWQFLHPHASFL